MKRILSVLLLGIAIFTFAFNSPALAGDIAQGAKVFSGNCVQCHARGRNLINPKKTLKKADLIANKIDTEDAIVNQVTKGKGNMPAFGRRLKAEQIQNVAAYVLDQADKWP